MIITVECPFCKRERKVSSYDIKRTGHSYCSGCAKRIKSYSYMVGTKIGRLLVLGFSEYNSEIPVNYTSMKVVCDCGAEKIVQAQFLKNGDIQSCGCLNREITSSRTGPLNHLWDSTLTDEERNLYRNNQQKVWSKLVRKRDKSCVVCGAEKELLAHHLNSYASNKEARYDINNGVTLCRKCHKDFHCNFMGDYRVPCTSKDFEEYLLQV